MSGQPSAWAIEKATGPDGILGRVMSTTGAKRKVEIIALALDEARREGIEANDDLVRIATERAVAAEHERDEALLARDGAVEEIEENADRAEQAEAEVSRLTADMEAAQKKTRALREVAAYGKRLADYVRLCYIDVGLSYALEPVRIAHRDFIAAFDAAKEEGTR